MIFDIIFCSINTNQLMRIYCLNKKKRVVKDDDKYDHANTNKMMMKLLCYACLYKRWKESMYTDRDHPFLHSLRNSARYRIEYYIWFSCLNDSKNYKFSNFIWVRTVRDKNEVRFSFWSSLIFSSFLYHFTPVCVWVWVCRLMFVYLFIFVSLSLRIKIKSVALRESYKTFWIFFVHTILWLWIQCTNRIFRIYIYFSSNGYIFSLFLFLFIFSSS